MTKLTKYPFDSHNMKQTLDTPRTPWVPLTAALLLFLLAAVPRLVGLNIRPLMHDESLFAYYAYNYFKTGSYTHIPMLHGPTLMLAAGKLFGLFGDSIVV